MFENFRSDYLQAGISLPYRTYIGILISVPLTTLISGLLISFFLITTYNFSYFIFIFPIIFSSAPLILLITYPYDKKKSRRQNIDTNLPYALSYMASIIETGVSPVSMFEAIAKFDQYEEVSKEAANIINQTKVLGKDLPSALTSYSEKTASNEFREILKGMVSIIRAGGSISSYLTQKYNEVMFKRVLKESEYEKSLSLYEELFTILLVVAPVLFLIIIFLGEALEPGTTNASTLFRLFTYIFLPVANIGFILFLKISHD